jgi:hypothetical protein
MELKGLDDDELFGLSSGSTASTSKGGLKGLDDDELFGGIELKAPERTILGTAGDIVGTAVKGVMAVPEAAVGLADIATGGKVGKALQDGVAIPGTDAYLRFDPRAGREVVDDHLTSDAQKAANRKVDEAGKNEDTLAGKVWETAKAAVKNPSTIATAVGESVPSLLAGGAAARGVMWLPKLRALAATGEKGAKAAGIIAGAVGEGAVSAGATAENIRQESKNGELTLAQSAIASGSGMLTGLLNFGGGKLAKKLGIGDIDSMMAGVDTATKKNVVRRVLEGAVAEGLIEEMPQSAQEQIAQNVATGKAWDDGLDKAVAMGTLAGGALGAGANMKPAAKAPAPAPAPAQPPAPQPTGPTQAQQVAQQAYVQVGGAGQAVNNLTAMRSKIASTLAGLPEQEQETAIVHLSGGDQQLAERMYADVQDEELVAQGNEAPLLDDDDMGALNISEMIRRDAGLLEQQDTEMPTATSVADAIVQQPEIVGNSAGYVPEPIPQVQAQVDAVKQGRKNAVYTGEEEFKQIDVNGLHYGRVTGTDGKEGVVISADPELIQQAITRASEVPLNQAMGEVLGYVNPTLTEAPQPGAAVIQQLDDQSGQVLKEEVVLPEQAGQIERVPGTTLNFTTPDQALASRAAQAPQAEPGSPFPGPATAATPEPSFNGGIVPVEEGQEYEAEENDYTRKLTDRINVGRGAGAQVSSGSIKAVKKVAPELKQMARALRFATGTRVVYITTDEDLWGASLRDENTIYMNVKTASPLMTLGHELVHVLEKQHPDIYEKLEEVVLKRITVSRAKKLKASLEKAAKAEQSDAAIQALRSELVAEAIGHMAQNESFWVDAFTATSKVRGMAEEFFTLLKDVLAKLKRAFIGQGYFKGSKELDQVQKAFNKAFAEWAKRHGPEFQKQQDELKAKQDAEKKAKAKVSQEDQLRKLPELPGELGDRARAIVKTLEDMGEPDVARSIGMAFTGAQGLTEAGVSFREDWLRRYQAQKAGAGKPKPKVEPRKVTLDSISFRPDPKGEPAGAIGALPKPILDATLKKVQELTDKLAEHGFHDNEVDPNSPQAARDIRDQIKLIEGLLHTLVGRRYSQMTGKGGPKEQGKTAKFLPEVEKELSELIGLDTTKHPGVNMDRKISTLGEWAEEEKQAERDPIEQIAIEATELATRKHPNTVDPRVDRILAREEYLQGIGRKQPELAKLAAQAFRSEPKRFSDLTGASPDWISAYASLIEKGLPKQEEKPAAPVKSNAPEHVAVGVDDKEFKQIVREFTEAERDAINDGQQVHHLFDKPAEEEIVRLEKKARVYHEKHGWMTVKEAKKKIAEWKKHAAEQGKTNANSEKVILSLFDLTGSWSKPWEEAGYQVYRFDIQDDSTYEDWETGEEKRIGDVMNFSTEFFNSIFGSFDGNDVYGVLAACPCTDFASSGARHFAAKDADGRTIQSIKLVQMTRATIEFFKPMVWAVENPVGRIEKLTGLPPWRLSFDPNHLGDPYTKKTLLWGRFNADLPIAPVEATEGSKMWSQYGGSSLRTKNARSATPEGFAYAFFMANNAVDHPVMAVANKFDRLDRNLIRDAIEAGVTPAQIDEAVQDHYYFDLDDEAGNQAIRDLIEEKRGIEPEADPEVDARVEALETREPEPEPVALQRKEKQPKYDVRKVKSERKGGKDEWQVVIDGEPGDQFQTRREADAWVREQKGLPPRKSAPKKKAAGGSNARSRSYEKNPFLTFLAEHGLFHVKDDPKSQKTEFSPDKNISVPGYHVALFRRDGKLPDALLQPAIELGYLPQGATESQLEEMIRRAVSGQRVAPVYGEGQAEQELERRMLETQQEREDWLLEDDLLAPDDLDANKYTDADPVLQARIGALMAEAEAHGVDAEDILMDVVYQTQNASQRDYQQAALLALQAAVARARGEGDADRGEPAGGEGDAPEGAQGRGAGESQEEGLTSPTQQDILDQQQRAEDASKAEAKADKAAADKAKADAQVNEFKLTGSDRPADANPDQDVLLQRNPLHFTDTAELLDHARNRKLPLDLGDAIAKRNYVEAMRLAKNPQQRQSTMRKIMDSVIGAVADSLIPVKRWIDNLPLDNLLKQRLTGDLYRADTLRAGMQKEVSESFTKRLFDAVDKASKQTKLTTDEVKTWAGYWMTAKYAPKANNLLIAKDRAALAVARATGKADKIAEAQQNLNDRLADVNGRIRRPNTPAKRGLGGGMNNAEAAAMVQHVEAMIPEALLKEIAQPVYDLMAWKKATDLSSGKVTMDMVLSWPNHADYVPLTGDPRATREDNDLFNGGNQLNQSKDEAMQGRKTSVADNAIDAAMAATIKSINFAAVQDFKRTLMRAYTEAQIGGHDIGLELENVTGIMRNSDDVVIYRDAIPNGLGQIEHRSYAFRFKDDRITDSIKKENVERTNRALEIIGTPTRLYARAVTQFMPMFAPINFVRDIWERSELLRTRDLYAADGTKINVSKAANEAIAQTMNFDVWKATMAKARKNGKMSLLRGDLEEMIRLGGSSVWGDYLSRRQQDLEEEMRRHGRLWNKVTGKINEKVEAYNNAFEMVPALVIYRSLKAQGMVAQDAAAAVLDLMNFKKKGAMMPAIRALYIFAQPAATSGYNLARYLSTRTGRIRFIAQTIIGIGLYSMLRAMWGDDDDEEVGNKLDNMGNYTVERSIPVKLGDVVVKVPVGFGPPQLSWATAVNIVRAVTGRYTVGEALGETVKAGVKSSAPIAPSDIELTKRPVDFLFQTFTPTILRPWLLMAQDQTAFGGPLTPQFKDPNKMKWQQAKRTTSTLYSEVAQEIADMTGIDIYPDQIKHLVDSYMVDPVSRLARQVLIDNPARQERGEPGQMPAISSVVDFVNDRQLLNTAYYRVREEAQDAFRKFNSDPEEYADLAEKAQAFRVFQAREKVISGMRSALKKARNDLDEDTLAERSQTIETQADEAHRELLKAYVGVE